MPVPLGHLNGPDLSLNTLDSETFDKSFLVLHPDPVEALPVITGH